MKALTIEKEQQHTEGIANVLNNISIVYRSRNDLQKATEYIEESIALNKKINNLNRLPAAYFNLNRIYLYQRRTDDALKLAQEELRIANQLQLKPAVQEALIILTEVYAQKKDHATALKYFRWQVALSDSIKGQESSMKFMRLQAIYENEKKEKELDLLKAERRLSESRNRLIYTATGAVFIIAIIMIVSLRNRIRREKEIARKSDELHHTQQSLIEAELANKQLAEKQLQQDLEFRHKELFTYTLNLDAEKQPDGKPAGRHSGAVGHHRQGFQDSAHQIDQGDRLQPGIWKRTGMNSGCISKK